MQQKPGKGTQTFPDTLISLVIMKGLLHPAKPSLLLSHPSSHPGTPSLLFSLLRGHKVPQLSLFGCWEGVVSATGQEEVPLFQWPACSKVDL